MRDKAKREVDFAVLRDGKPWLLVECKTTETEPSPHLLYFRSLLAPQHAIQPVDIEGYDRRHPGLGVRVVSYERFFSAWV